jgi:2-iminobutanoate/2-iminopropanoate deaminase
MIRYGRRWRNCEAILRADGASLDDVIKVGVLHQHRRLRRLERGNREVVPSEPPTRYVARLGVELPRLLISSWMKAFTA